MTKEAQAGEEGLDRLTENLEKIESLVQRLVESLSRREPTSPALSGLGLETIGKSVSAYWQEMLHNPAKFYEQQLAYWGQSVRQFIEAQQAVLTGHPVAEDSDAPLVQDRRFANPLWRTHPYFRLVRQQYALNVAAIEQAVAETTHLPDGERRQIAFFARQLISLMAPTNFLWTNPDALQRAIDTEGESLLKGLENLIADLEASDGDLIVRLADERAFELGRDIAATPGQVIYRNRLMELIQYAPATETVSAVPLIVFPPWINKYYVMDLKPENSLIRWITEQGFTLFVVSWVNPDHDFADVGLDDYVTEGYLRAIEEVKAITGEPRVNTLGYCIGGTVLSLVLALLHKRGDKSVRSATLLTVLTDFTEQGEFTPFLQEDFISAIEKEVAETGVLRGALMTRTFSFLRANDLVYGPAVRSYMMGEAPPAFDLLAWNGDNTNLPGRMAVDYLRGLCQENRFAAEGFELLGETVQLRDVRVPLFAVSCETDHIAAWRDCYRGIRQMGARSKAFVLSESGHIAGIINPPSRGKYGHFVNDDLSVPPEAWKDAASYEKASWWLRWGTWLKRRSGRQVAARQPGDSSHKPLAPAPGTYVRGKAKI